MPKEYDRPLVVVSRCLGFAACRWNGQMVNDPFVERLGRWVDYRPACPEVESGLGVPRDPVRLVEGEHGPSLVQPAGGRDWTGEMLGWGRAFLEALPAADGFLLKGRSPSCGPNDVKVYASPAPGAAARKGRGLFAALAAEAFPGAAMEHEGRVKNFHLREHFLTRIFTLAAFRRASGKPGRAALSRFHAANKLLLMAYHQTQMRALGRLAAGALPLPQTVAAYGEGLALALARPPRRGAIVNVLDHAAGYFKKELGGAEKKHFRTLVGEYQQGRASLSGLQALLESWVARFQTPYLAGQSFFAPYPRELVDLSDTGKGSVEHL